MTDPVLTNIENNTLHIQFNRPEKKNAITLAMYDLAAQAFEQANDDPLVRSIIISGTGDCFTSGNDLMDFLSAAGDDIDKRLLRFLKAVPDCKKPVIAAIHGHAVGIGTTLLLHCDFVFAEDNAKFQLPFTNLGLCPEFGSSLLLPRQIGQLRANELLMNGNSFDSLKALEYGLVNAVVEDALASAMQQANHLNQQPAAAIRLTKSLLHRADREELAQTIEVEGTEFLKRMKSPEAKEAITAFMEKRTPDFSQFE